MTDKLLASAEMRAAVLEFAQGVYLSKRSHEDRSRFKSEFDKTWRWLDQRRSIHIPKKRVGLGRGNGVEHLYSRHLVFPMAYAIFSRIISRHSPAYIDICTQRLLVQTGLVPPGMVWGVHLGWNRAAFEILNEESSDIEQFQSALRRILTWREPDEVSFEWSMRRVRTALRAEASEQLPSSNPHPGKEAWPIQAGLEMFIQRGELHWAQGAQGHYVDMPVTEDAIKEFQTKRKAARLIFQKSLAGDSNALNRLRAKAMSVVSEMGDDWIASGFGLAPRKDGEYDWRSYLCRRPLDLTDYPFLRVAWITDSFRRPIQESLAEWFFVCSNPECANIEQPFRQDLGPKTCRRCRAHQPKPIPRKRRRR